MNIDPFLLFEGNRDRDTIDLCSHALFKSKWRNRLVRRSSRPFNDPETHLHSRSTFKGEAYAELLEYEWLNREAEIDPASKPFSLELNWLLENN